MDLQRVSDAMAMAFARNVRDGTIEIGSDETSVVVDGGNRSLTAHRTGIVNLDLPMNDPAYYDDDPDIFLGNVLGVEAEQSLAMLHRSFGGALVEGLRRSGETWSDTLANRIASTRVWKEAPLRR